MCSARLSSFCWKTGHVNGERVHPEKNSTDCSQSTGSEVDFEDEESFKEKLLNELDELDEQSVGSIASMGSFAEAPNPGLFIKGVGFVGLPVSTRDAAAILSTIRSTCKEALSGAPADSNPDTLLPGPQGLTTDDFELRNPRWKDFENRVLGAVVKDLGIVGGTTAACMQLRVLLIHETGALIDRRHEAIKAPSSVATVMIALPCPHSGGDLLVTARDRKASLKTAETSDFSFTYLAHFSDVEQASSVLEEGYRLALVYDLVESTGELSSAAGVGLAQQRVTRLLDAWRGDDLSGPEQLVYMLEHRYPNASLRTSSLKGHDQVVAELLGAAGAAVGVSCFLANVDRTLEGQTPDYDDYDWPQPVDNVNGGDPDAEIHPEKEFEDVESESFELVRVVRPDGTLFAETVPFGEACILQNDPFEDVGPYEEIDQGDNTLTHTFRKSAVVLVN